MDSLTNGIGSLLLDPKYSDLEIRCDGKTFRVHRAIVCSKSKVLAEECDGVGEVSTSYEKRIRQKLTSSLRNGQQWVVEHAVFDPSTFERMLQFIYCGDYDVKVVVASVQANGAKAGAKDGTATTKPDSYAVKPISRSPRDSPMIAHAFVSAIAKYYKLPALKVLAEKKYTKAKAAMTANEFLELARLLSSHKDDWNRELLAILMDEHVDWLSAESFTSVLAADTVLRDFAAVAIPAAFKCLARKASECETKTNTQSAANDALLTDLDKANDDLTKANTIVRELNTQARVLRADVEGLECKNLALQVEIRRTNDAARDTRQKTRTDVKATNEEKEKIKTETARADKAAEIIVQIHSMVNGYDGCRNCGLAFVARLAKDDRIRKGKSLRGYIVCCRDCGQKQYGKKIE